MDSFRRDGLTFDVRDAGPRDGEPVVLLHGFPQDSAAWDRVAPALHQHGLRTLAPDQRGYSPMARPRGRAHYRLRETVGDVLALLDAAGLESAHVVGHDWGGIVAWGLAGLPLELDEADAEVLARLLFTLAEELGRILLEEPTFPRERIVDSTRRFLALLPWD